MYKKIISMLIVLIFGFESTGFAQVAGQLDISSHISAGLSNIIQDKFRPIHLRYISFNPIEDNFKVLLDKGDLKNPDKQLVDNTTRELLRYFLIGVSLPNDSFWVNLRPDATNGIMDEDLAKTDVGKILISADLQLKKDTAKYTSPETLEGREYWDKLYKKAEELYGTENVTIPTLNRPWILPDEIIVREAQGSAYIYKATMKVMLEDDYLKASTTYNFQDERARALNQYSCQLLKEKIMPRITREINSAKRYANLRQVYYSLILAQWFKQAYSVKRQAVRMHSKIDSRNLTGLTSQEPWNKDAYYQAYHKSFKEGEYNIKEPRYISNGQVIRNYISGGLDMTKEEITLRIISGQAGLRATSEEVPYLDEKYISRTVSLDGRVKKDANIISIQSQNVIVGEPAAVGRPMTIKNFFDKGYLSGTIIGHVYLRKIYSMIEDFDEKVNKRLHAIYKTARELDKNTAVTLFVGSTAKKSTLDEQWLVIEKQLGINLMGFKAEDLRSGIIKLAIAPEIAQDTSDYNMKDITQKSEAIKVMNQYIYNWFESRFSKEFLNEQWGRNITVYAVGVKSADAYACMNVKGSNNQWLVHGGLFASAGKMIRAKYDDNEKLINDGFIDVTKEIIRAAVDSQRVLVSYEDFKAFGDDEKTGIKEFVLELKKAIASGEIDKHWVDMVIADQDANLADWDRILNEDDGGYKEVISDLEKTGSEYEGTMFPSGNKAFNEAIKIIKKLADNPEKTKILIVEDTPRWQELYKKLLQKIGFVNGNTEIFSTAQEGIDAYRNSNFDLVITDFNFSWDLLSPPKENGIKFAQAIRDINQDAPIIMSSASNFQEFEVEKIIERHPLDGMLSKIIIENYFKAISDDGGSMGYAIKDKGFANMVEMLSRPGPVKLTGVQKNILSRKFYLPTTDESERGYVKQLYLRLNPQQRKDLLQAFIESAKRKYRRAAIKAGIKDIYELTNEEAVAFYKKFSVLSIMPLGMLQARLQRYYDRIGIKLEKNANVRDLSVDLLSRYVTGFSGETRKKVNADKGLLAKATALITAAFVAVIIGKAIVDNKDKKYFGFNYDQALIELFNGDFDFGWVAMADMVYGDPQIWGGQGQIWESATEPLGNMDVSGYQYLDLEVEANMDGFVKVQLLDQNMRDGDPVSLTGWIPVHAGKQTIRTKVSEYTSNKKSEREIVLHYGETAFTPEKKNAEGFFVKFKGYDFTNDEGSIFDGIIKFFVNLFSFKLFAVSATQTDSQGGLAYIPTAHWGGNGQLWESEVWQVVNKDVSQGTSLDVVINPNMAGTVIVQVLDDKTPDGDKFMIWETDVQAGQQVLKIPLDVFENQGVDLKNVREVVVHYGQEFHGRKINKVGFAVELVRYDFMEISAATNNNAAAVPTLIPGIAATASSNRKEEEESHPAAGTQPQSINPASNPIVKTAISWIDSTISPATGLSKSFKPTDSDLAGITNPHEKRVLRDGLVTYDGALEQVLYILYGDQEMADTYTDIYWNDRLPGYRTIIGGYIENNKDQPFIYDPNNPKIINNKKPGERGFGFKIVDASGKWQDDSGFTWSQWVPGAGENAWAKVIGPMQVYYQKYGDKYFADATELKLAEEGARAAMILQADNGGVRMAPIGSWHSNEPGTNPYEYTWMYNEISTENCISWYASFRMLYEITGKQEYKNAMDRLENYFRAAYDAQKGVMIQGMHYNAATQKWEPNTIFATDCQTWFIDALGVQKVDSMFGDGAAYKMWQNTKAEAGVFDQNGNFIGFDFTNYKVLGRGPVVSVEWTEGGILSAMNMIEYYGQSHPDWAASLQQDINSAQKYVDTLKNPDGSYFYSSERVETGHGWTAAGRIGSGASTVWRALVELKFNVFILGGGKNTKVAPVAKAVPQASATPTQKSPLGAEIALAGAAGAAAVALARHNKRDDGGLDVYRLNNILSRNLYVGAGFSPNLEPGDYEFLQRVAAASEATSSQKASARRLLELRDKAFSDKIRDDGGKKKGLGGIDFRSLPIITQQAMNNLAIGATGLAVMPLLSKLEGIDLDQKIAELQKMVDADMVPSPVRIKECLQAACLKENSQVYLDKLLSFMVDMMKLEEEKCCITNRVVKDVMLVLESGISPKELKQVVTGAS